MECPRCHLENPPNALRCDCGYDFSSGTVRKSYVTVPDRVVRSWIKGRYNRARFFWTMFAIGVGSYAIHFLVFLLGGASAHDALGLLMWIVTVVVAVFPVVKRLHDLDMPDWRSCLLLVPVYNIFLLFVLLFQRGTQGPNRYGPYEGR